MDANVCYSLHPSMNGFPLILNGTEVERQCGQSLIVNVKWYIEVSCVCTVRILAIFRDSSYCVKCEVI